MIERRHKVAYLAAKQFGHARVPNFRFRLGFGAGQSIDQGSVGMGYILGQVPPDAFLGFPGESPSGQNWVMSKVPVTRRGPFAIGVSSILKKFRSDCAAQYIPPGEHPKLKFVFVMISEQGRIGCEI